MTTATATKPKGSSTTAIPRTDLLAALSAVGKAVSNRSPKPILRNVRIGDGMISGTDLEVRIDRAIDSDCEPFLVPHDRLTAIVREARGETVKITAKGTSITVKCGSGSWTLLTEDVAEYPTWEPAELKTVCRLPADQFARAVRATVYATDTESSRYALGAVLLEILDGNPTFVGTDGRRMAVAETEIDQAVDDRELLIPARAFQIVGDMAAGDGSVQIEVAGSDARFTLDGTTITARLTDGKFPRWRDVTGDPEGEANVLEIKEFIAATRGAAIVTSDQSKGVELSWNGESLVLSGRSSEHGESTVKCPLVVQGTTATVKLDPVFIVDFLRHLPDDEEPQVEMFVKDAESRVLLRCGPYTGVIMPLAKDA
jgi:DNA polymerase-3 subunit beta